MRGGGRSNAGPARWISASELADYAYCPRSWWYRGHPPAGGPTPASERRARDGQAYHQRTLAAELRREAWAGGIVAAAVIAAAVLAFLLLRGAGVP